MTEFLTPVEWLVRLGAQLKDFYDFQCREAKRIFEEKRTSTLKTASSSVRRAAKQVAVPASVQKSTKRNRRQSILASETPLKNKSPNIQPTDSLTTSPQPAQTPLRFQSTAPEPLTEAPATEGRLRRAAAIKANKYVDIVARRLEQVPKNGATPKIFKIANKLQSKESIPATPSTRKSAMLSSVAAQTPATKVSRTPEKKGLSNRLIESEQAAVDLNSPSSINIAPASVTRFRFHDALSAGPTIVPESATRPKAKQETLLPDPDSTPLKNVQQKSKADDALVSLNEPLATTMAEQSKPPATPKVAAPVPQVEVEFVAPQSVLRSSKRPRRPVELLAYSEVSASATKKAATAVSSSAIPAIQALKITTATSTPSKPALAAESVPPPAPSVPKSMVRSESIAMSAFTVPSLAQKNPETSSSNEEVLPKRTPIRLKTPSRAKAALPSLADPGKIAVIEVPKSISKDSLASTRQTPIATATPKASATPKVEPWTSRFLKDISKAAPAVPLAAKPVDTSKISGFSGSASIPVANVPIVPKFPLNLANIASVTKSISSISTSSTATATAPVVQDTKKELIKEEGVKQDNAKPALEAKTRPAVVPESPLSRAKRIDMENKAREDRLKRLIANKSSSTDQVKIPESTVVEVKTPAGSVAKPATSVVKAPPPMQSSKLPVKTNILPSPKVPSRLAEAFSGVEAELPPIDDGLVEEETILNKVLAGGSAAAPVTLKVPATPSQAQLHKTAVLNSVSKKLNPTDHSKSTSTPKTTSSSALASSSPALPEIPSDDDEIDRQGKSGKENRPNWAMTPNLTVALNAQKSQRPEDIFGKVQPIKLEDFFKRAGKKYTNRSNL